MENFAKVLEQYFGATAAVDGVGSRSLVVATLALHLLPCPTFAHVRPDRQNFTLSACKISSRRTRLKRPTTTGWSCEVGTLRTVLAQNRPDGFESDAGICHLARRERTTMLYFSKKWQVHPTTSPTNADVLGTRKAHHEPALRFPMQ